MQVAETFFKALNPILLTICLIIQLYHSYKFLRATKGTTLFDGFVAIEFFLFVILFQIRGLSK